MNLAGNGKCAKNWNLNTNVTALQQHGCTRAYAASFSIHLCSCTSQCKVFHSEKKKNRSQPNEERRGFGLENIWKKREKYGQFHILFFELSLSDQTESTSFDISGWVQNEIVDIPDRLGWTGTNLENRGGRVSIFPTRPRFLRWSAIIPEKWELKFVPSGTSAMDFAHYQSPKLLGSSPPITNKHGVSRESGTDFWRLSDISAKSGMVGKK